MLSRGPRPPPGHRPEPARRNLGVRPTFLQPLGPASSPTAHSTERRHFRTPEAFSLREQPRAWPALQRVPPSAHRRSSVSTPVAATRLGAEPASAEPALQRRPHLTPAQRRNDGVVSYGTPAFSRGAGELSAHRKLAPAAASRAPLADVSPLYNVARPALVKAWPTSKETLPRISSANAAYGAQPRARAAAASRAPPGAGARIFSPESDGAADARPALAELKTPTPPGQGGLRESPLPPWAAGCGSEEGEDGAESARCSEDGEAQRELAELERSRHVGFCSPLHESFYYTKRSMHGSSTGSSAFNASADLGASARLGAGGDDEQGEAARGRGARNPAELNVLLTHLSLLDPAHEPPPASDSPWGGGAGASEQHAHDRRARAGPFALAKPSAHYREPKPKAVAPVDFRKTLNFADVDVKSARKLGAPSQWK